MVLQASVFSRKAIAAFLLCNKMLTNTVGDSVINIVEQFNGLFETKAELKGSEYWTYSSGDQKHGSEW